MGTETMITSSTRIPRMPRADFEVVERFIRAKVTHPNSFHTRERNLAICRELLVDGRQNKMIAAERKMTPQRVHSIMRAFIRRAQQAKILVE